MADQRYVLQLMNQERVTTEMPDDVTMAELIPEVLSAFDQPTLSPDGKQLTYTMAWLDTGHNLAETESFSSAGVPPGANLFLRGKVIAGSSG